MTLIKVLAKATYVTSMTYKLLFTGIMIVQLVRTLKKK